MDEYFYINIGISWDFLLQHHPISIVAQFLLQLDPQIWSKTSVVHTGYNPTSSCGFSAIYALQLKEHLPNLHGVFRQTSRCIIPPHETRTTSMGFQRLVHGSFPSTGLALFAKNSVIASSPLALNLSGRPGHSCDGNQIIIPSN